MKLLIISDLHYPLGSMDEAKRIIRKERPDHVAFLGDNIDTSSGASALSLYSKFVGEISASFPLRRTIMLLGDGDYLFQADRKKILNYANSLKTMNRNHVVYRKGNMVFFHGNVERYRNLERLGKHVVTLSVSFGMHSVMPTLVGSYARIVLGAKWHDFLFLGHLHFLGKSRISRTTFCGTLNRRARYFGKRSLGYVVVDHEDFTVRSMEDIKTVGAGR
jgi:predicted phosphodiesterase